MMLAPLAQLFQEPLNVHTVEDHVEALAHITATGFRWFGALLIATCALATWLAWQNHKLQGRLGQLETRLPGKTTAASS